MSNVEDYIQKDGDSGLSSPDESMSVFTGVQNNSSDIDELDKLLGETFTSEANDSEMHDSEVMINTEYDSFSVEDEHPVSALEELE
ncbi:MAG: hypothetical protein KAT12_09160, partial [Gammaproteobacteria bacterium]|nr:hypothetical protein [Gammaproteobacteria bacterium]